MRYLYPDSTARILLAFPLVTFLLLSLLFPLTAVAELFTTWFGRGVLFLSALLVLGGALLAERIETFAAAPLSDAHSSLRTRSYNTFRWLALLSAVLFLLNAYYAYLALN